MGQAVLGYVHYLSSYEFNLKFQCLKHGTASGDDHGTLPKLSWKHKPKLITYATYGPFCIGLLNFINIPLNYLIFIFWDILRQGPTM